MGIVSKLIETFINTVKDNNVKRIYIENIKRNKVAKSLYEKLNFKISREVRKMEL